MNPSPPPSSQDNNNNGIDIRDALSILSSHHEAIKSNKSGGRCDAKAIKSNKSGGIPNDLKQMGQTIDIVNEMEFAKPDALGRGCDCGAINNDDGVDASEKKVDEDEERKHAAMKLEREKRAREIQTKLLCMNVTDLLGMIFTAQEERVATYKSFDDGLTTILMSGNISTYPTLCAKVTASFSVLSDTINAVKSTLVNMKRNDISNAITQLQKSESEKLNLTAALHLERLRLRNSELDVDAGLNDNDDDNKGDEVDGRTIQLLKNGIQSLQSKISKVIESINEAMDELRCIAVEENE